MTPSLCLFSSYSDAPHVPHYVRVYLTELQRHFTKIIFITNERMLHDESASWLHEYDIELTMVSNEGFDFGMWYKVLQRRDFAEFERVALVNDSAVLFAPLDDFFLWFETCGYDYAGMVLSSVYTYHVQSYFVVMNRRAFNVLKNYFAATGIVNDYRKVIQAYEIGISKELVAHGLGIGARYESLTRDCPTNPSFALLPELIRSGMPIIKKKIVFRRYRPGEWWGLMLMGFDTDERRYIELIKSAHPHDLLIDFDQLLRHHNVRKDFVNKIGFKAGMHIVKLLKPIGIVRRTYKALVRVKRKIEKREAPLL